jgi:hypothetical protein
VATVPGDVSPTPHTKKKLTINNELVTKCHKGPQTDSLDKRPKLRKMGMRFCVWNVRSVYRAGLLMAVAKEISKYKLNLVEVQEVRRDRGGTEPADEYTYLYGNGNENHDLGTGFFIHK